MSEVDDGPIVLGKLNTPVCPEMEHSPRMGEARESVSQDTEVFLRPPPPEFALCHQTVGRPMNFHIEMFDGSQDWPEYVVYFEQMAELYGWDRPTMAMNLGLSLKGTARTVLAGLSFPQRRDYNALKEALTQNYSPPQKVHLYMAELKSRKRYPHESLSDLGRDIARLTRLAYPTADQGTRETISINAFLDSLPGPAMEIRLHVIKGHPNSLQEAVAYAMEVDVILESQGYSGKRSNVRMVGGDEVTIPKSDLALLQETLIGVEKRLAEIEKSRDLGSSRDYNARKAEAKCFNCGKRGHYRHECRSPPKSGNDGGRRDSH